MEWANHSSRAVAVTHGHVPDLSTTRAWNRMVDQSILPLVQAVGAVVCTRALYAAMRRLAAVFLRLEKFVGAVRLERFGGVVELA